MQNIPISGTTVNRHFLEPFEDELDGIYQSKALPPEPTNEEPNSKFPNIKTDRIKTMKKYVIRILPNPGQ